MVKKVVTNPDMDALINLKGSVHLCDTCSKSGDCPIQIKFDEEKTESYKEAPRHAIKYAIWSCNQYRRKKRGRGRPKKTSNP